MKLSRAGIVATATLAVAGMAVVGRAELLRCQGPDGRTIYTDNKALCPGVKPFEPSGELQQAVGSETPDGAASRAPLEERRDRARLRRRAAEVEAGEARRWREKKQQGEEALRMLTKRRSELDDFVSWCNRGGSVITRDDAGIKRNVPCKQVREEYAAIDGEEVKLRAYLDSGLAEECRKAGCLPGWIR